MMIVSPPTRLVVAALLLAAWGGAAVLAVAVVAPVAFAVLPSRTLAGAVVAQVLPALFISGIALGGTIVAIAGWRVRLRAASIAAGVTVVSCAVAQFAIDPRIARLRDQIGGPVEALELADPRRVAFGQLHGYSVGGLGVAMLAAAAALAVIVLALRPRAQ